MRDRFAAAFFWVAMGMWFALVLAVRSAFGLAPESLEVPAGFVYFCIGLAIFAALRYFIATKSPPRLWPRK